MTQKSIIITIIIALIVGGAAFFGGMKYQQAQATSASGSQFASGQGRFGPGAGRFGGRAGGMATVGKVVSADSNSITVQLQDGSSKIVNFSGSTKIVKTDTASATDLASGTQVAVFGTTNSDGSVTAQNIQINPSIMMRGAKPSQSTGQPTQAAGY